MASGFLIAGYLAAAVALGYLPGRTVFRLLGVSFDAIEQVVLVCGLSALISAVVYASCVACGRADWFWCWPVAATVAYGWTKWRSSRTEATRAVRPPCEKRSGARWALLGVFLAGLVTMAVLPLYFRNLTWRPDGSMRAYPVADVYMHLAIAGELTHTLPPQCPVFAGVPLSYHVGNDLVVAMLAKVTGGDLRDLTVRVVPSLLLGLSMLTVFACARRWLKSEAWAAVATALVFFGEDFSYLASLAFGSGSVERQVFATYPSVFSLFSLNPMVPAVGMLFAGLLALQLYLEENRVAGLVLAAMFFAGLVEVKIFVAIHVCVSLGVAAAAAGVIGRDWRLFRSAALTAVLAGPLALGAAWLNRGGGGIVLTSGGWRECSQLATAWGLGGAPHGWLFGLVPLVVATALGPRVIASGAILRSLRQPGREGGVRFLVAAFVVLGVAAAMIFRVVPAGDPEGYNQSAWFFAQSKYVAWLFAVESLRGGAAWVARRGWPPRRAAAVVALAALAVSVPGALEYFRNFTRSFRALPAGDVSPAQTQILTALQQAAQPGDVIMCEEAMLRPVIALTTCRLLLGDYAENMVPRAAWAERKAQVQEFWDDWHRGLIRSDRLRGLKVRFVLAPAEVVGTEAATAAGLTMVARNSRYVLFAASR